jgi:hypothetical protein
VADVVVSGLVSTAHIEAMAVATRESSAAGSTVSSPKFDLFTSDHAAREPNFVQLTSTSSDPDSSIIIIGDKPN